MAFGLEIFVDSKWTQSSGFEGVAGRPVTNEFKSVLAKELNKRGETTAPQIANALTTLYDLKARNPIVTGRMRAALNAKVNVVDPKARGQVSWMSWGYFPEDVSASGGSGHFNPLESYIHVREFGGILQTPPVFQIQFWAKRVGLPSDAGTA